MIIESLIRLGRPFTEGGLTSEEVIWQITDVGGENTRNFWRHVFVVEVNRLGEESVVFAHPMLSFGELERKGKRDVFVPDQRRVLAAPWIFPGANPTNPQGRYGVPVYPFFEKQWDQFVEATTGPVVLERFLEKRLERTPDVNLAPEELREVVAGLHQAFSSVGDLGKAKRLGLIVLAVVERGGVFEYADTSEAPVLVTSKIEPGKRLTANLELMLNRIWKTKAEEGAEHGRELGDGAACSLCRASDELVSPYSKAWPWLATTWTAPFSYLSEYRNKKVQLAENVGLCTRCYAALTYGSKVFDQLGQLMPTWLTKELFSPVDSPAGRRRARAERLYGSVLVLPLLDEWFFDEDAKEAFVNGLRYMLEPRAGRSYDLHLFTITGLELVLPEDLSGDEHRLTITYYTKGRSVNLHSVIEDVVPSVARRVKDELEDLREPTRWLLSQLDLKEKFDDRSNSLPYLLSRAYGVTYLWQTLAAVLRWEPLSRARFARSSVHRMTELSRGLPNTGYDLRSEVFFYLTFREFLRLHNGNVGKGDVPVRPWQDLQSMLDGPIDSLNFDNAEEIGFAAGHLVGQFSRQYYTVTKKRDGKGKDFLKHRVMTFGSTLTPDIVFGKAVAKFEEWGHRIDANPSRELLKRAGVWLNAYSLKREEVQHQRDSFMAAFWSGYWLQESAKHNGGNTDGREG